MSRRKLIRKLVIPAIAVFVVSIIILILELPITKSLYKTYIKNLESHISKLTEQYQDYLTTTAKEIKSIPVAPDAIGKIQSKILKEEPSIKLYLWMNDVSGEFIFGSPTAVFKRINQGFDRYKETILAEGFYMDRNDFLIKLVDLHKYVDFTEFNSAVKNKDELYLWREYNESMRLKTRRLFTFPKSNYRFNQWSSDYSRPRSFILSTPVSDSEGTGLGDLYLKIDDSNNESMYYSNWKVSRNNALNTLFEICRIFAVLSGIFLWFLVPTWVYIDAKQRDVKNPLGWAIFTLISFIIFGLTIYLVTRPTTLKSFHCPHCENELNGTKTYCPYCGYDVSSSFCPECQYPIKQQYHFCPSCRAELRQEKQEIEKALKKGKKTASVEKEK